MTFDNAGLQETMSSLRAVRRLRPDPVPAAVLERVLQAACWAPSGGNQQSWRVIAVRDPELKAGIQDVYLPAWQAYSAHFMDLMSSVPNDEIERLRKVVAAGDYLANNMAETPVILVFCADLRAMAITDAKLDRISVVGGASVYPAVQNAMLACVSEGLGCTLTTLHCVDEPAIVSLLDIPPKWAVPAIVPIGYPVGRGHGPIRRKAPAELAFSDRFGQPL